MSQPWSPPGKSTSRLCGDPALRRSACASEGGRKPSSREPRIRNGARSLGTASSASSSAAGAAAVGELLLARDTDHARDLRAEPRAGDHARDAAEGGAHQEDLPGALVHELGHGKVFREAPALVRGDRRLREPEVAVVEREHPEACGAQNLGVGQPAAEVGRASRARTIPVLPSPSDAPSRRMPSVARNQPTFAVAPAPSMPQRRPSGGRLLPFASSALVILPQPLTSATARKSNAAAVPLNAVGGCCSGRSRGARRRGGSDPRRRRAPRGGSGRRARRPVLRRGRGRAAGQARAASTVRRR